MSLPSFMQLLAADSTLRDGFAAYLDGRIAAENSLDRVDDKHSVEHQRGRVAELRSLRHDVKKAEDQKENPS